uniref:V2 protein defective n=1 Tax=Cotton leaf curl Gezira virus TaxID=222459 RepID=A0A224LAY5_9GEMI|nr:V2 protein defective [Cotton leaf curl Gezira virus]
MKDMNRWYGEIVGTWSVESLTRRRFYSKLNSLKDRLEFATLIKNTCLEQAGCIYI